jgi:hypothetical protein
MSSDKKTLSQEHNMKLSKSIKIGLASVFGVSIIVAGTLFLADAFTQDEVTYGRGQTTTTGNTVYDNNRVGGNQVNQDLSDADLPEATVSYEQTTYSLEEMITMAITDEYLAHKEYEIILAEYGNINPFANIINAEVTHIEELLPLFEAYDFAVPADNAIQFVALPGSLQEAYETGVQAEVNNIGMYESFLKQDLPEDVRAVFEQLMAASVNHLEAFSRNANK